MRQLGGYDSIFHAFDLDPMSIEDCVTATEIYLGISKGNSEMVSLGNFDATTIDPTSTFEALPPGEYVAQIVASEMKPTKTGNGNYIKFEFDVIDGPSRGKKLFENVNIDNPNATTVEIAQRTLSAICHAAGVMARDTEQLHFKPMTLTVITVPAGPDKHGTYRQAKNEIKGFAAYGNPVPTVFNHAPLVAPKTTQPWKK